MVKITMKQGYFLSYWLKLQVPTVILGFVCFTSKSKLKHISCLNGNNSSNTFTQWKKKNISESTDSLFIATVQQQPVRKTVTNSEFDLSNVQNENFDFFSVFDPEVSRRFACLFRMFGWVFCGGIPWFGVLTSFLVRRFWNSIRPWMTVTSWAWSAPDRAYVLWPGLSCRHATFLCQRRETDRYK